ncbi:hypothetical protein P280DRAFT_318964 [Massarina eburnea CBS 473.64]|uniref:Uncharacterized protein n=1 Tax=Massarina eburnea CBS 473.64 TaxID=1395130 RepID=A0A6A6RGA3_9PLEO|nr:hypothetical protein P280DRAFT_318964 [Massarina eburnea CBS 473.64]
MHRRIASHLTDTPGRLHSCRAMRTLLCQRTRPAEGDCCCCVVVKPVLEMVSRVPSFRFH